MFKFKSKRKVIRKVININKKINGKFLEYGVKNFLSLKWLNFQKNSNTFNQKQLIQQIDLPINKYTEYFWIEDRHLSIMQSNYSYIFSPNLISIYIDDNIPQPMLKKHISLFLNSINKSKFNYINFDFLKEETLKFRLRSHRKLNTIANIFYPYKSKRSIKRCIQRLKYIKSKFLKKNSLFQINNFIYNLIKKNTKTTVTGLDLKKQNRLFYNNQQKIYIKQTAIPCGFPLINNTKRSLYFFFSKMNRLGEYKDRVNAFQFLRHPSTQLSQIKKNLIYGTVLNFGFYIKGKQLLPNAFIKLYKISWRYFKFRIEKFFYSQLGARVHIWFLNIWDIFLNGVDSLWKWQCYESKTIYDITRKGRRFFIEGRETAKFYVRTMTLSLTMVGGVKLFLDKISILMRKYRNNWAFILSTTKTLRFCINFFWFRFFINYKVTLQGKIGGFLRAQKKIFKKGNITIEDRDCLITYYRGYPVTRFGSYNLSFWLQYRIPNLIEKFEDSEYIDTMKILLSMYSVSWLASRLSEIIREILIKRTERVKRKVTQYNRRVSARRMLVIDILKKTNSIVKFEVNSDSIDKSYTKLKSLIHLYKDKKIIKNDNLSINNFSNNSKFDKKNIKINNFIKNSKPNEVSYLKNN